MASSSESSDLSTVLDARMELPPKRETGWLRTGLAVAGATGVIGITGLIVWLPPEEASDRAVNRYTEIACAQQILVGRVDSVSDGSGEGLLTVTVSVDEWLKPSSGPAKLVLGNINDPKTSDPSSAWDLPVSRLIYVSGGGKDRVTQYTDRVDSIEPQVAFTKDDLRDARSATCPDEAR